MPEMTFQHAAQVYWSMIFHPIPTIRGEKDAAEKWKRYQIHRPSQAEIQRWWPPGSRQNIALLLGPSARLLCVNVNMKHGDDGLGTLKSKGHVIPDDLTPTIRTPHAGFAYFFRPPNRERYPYPFKTHTTVRDWAGIELRGEKGYQLVPPSHVDATARDPAGSYRFVEPWTITKMWSDLAELPEWLLDLWITCDRSTTPSYRRPSRPLIPQEPVPKNRGVHTVVVSKDATTVCSRDTTTVCTPPSRGHGLGASGLQALLHDRATQEACATCFGWPVDGGNFACPLPGHEEARPSASLYWNDKGELVFRDWHKRSGKEFWTLSEIYAACVSGRIPIDENGLARSLSDVSMATWSLRMLVDAKCLEPYPVELPPLPHEALPSVVRLYEGLRLLFGTKWAYEPGQPTMFTRSFAMDWCGVSDKTAWVGTQWLLQRQIIRPAGKYKGRPVYLPGAP